MSLQNTHRSRTSDATCVYLLQHTRIILPYMYNECTIKWRIISAQNATSPHSAKRGWDHMWKLSMKRWRTKNVPSVILHLLMQRWSKCMKRQYIYQLRAINVLTASMNQPMTQIWNVTSRNITPMEPIKQCKRRHQDNTWFLKGRRHKSPCEDYPWKGKYCQ